MGAIFRRDDALRDVAPGPIASDDARLDSACIGLLLALLALLLAGTLRIWPLAVTIHTLDLPFSGALAWHERLLEWVPFDAARGEEGVSVQGSILIGLLFALGISAWRGLEGIVEGANSWTRVTMLLACLTLLLATLRIEAREAGLQFGLTGRTMAVALAMTAVWQLGRQLRSEQLHSWLWEAWRFVKQIFPLLVVGVFVVGVVRSFLQPEWIEQMSGSNTLPANAIAVGFGVFMYFPTLVEVPVARMFLDLGMHPGPLLAYLMADPELSLQSMLMVAAVVGRRKTAVYVGLVAVFSICVGLLFGAWVDAGIR
jgi:uncharacterized membrane protein YraQ (UPF0718 family)